MTKTPAAEALEWLYDLIGERTMSWEALGNRQTIEETLSLLDRVQKGECKVMEREPTEDMLANGQSHVATKNIYRAMYDAAPPMPGGEIE